MNARRRTAARRGLPPNLYQKANGYFYFRNPITKKDKGIGHDKNEALREARAANAALEEKKGQRNTVADWVRGKSVRTVKEWAAEYEAEIIEKGEKKPNTLTMIKSALRAIVASDFAELDLKDVTTEHCATFIRTCEIERGPRMAQVIRTRLKDLFLAACERGFINVNPVKETRVPKAKVKRDRLSIEQFLAIRTVAEPWLVNAMNLAILTAQAREYISDGLFDDAHDGFLWIIRGKTEAKIRVQLDLRLDVVGLSIAELIRQCRDNAISKYLIHRSRSKGKAKAGSKYSLSTITKEFAKARKLAKITWREGRTPPSFHEIRSLSERLYHDQYGGQFTQKLLGHKSEKMTAVYHDVRGSEWINVTTG